MCFRFTSPRLAVKDQTIKECPVGVVLRETDYIYDALNAHAYADKAGLDILNASPWLQSVMHIVSSEKARLWDMAEAERKSKGDAALTRKAIRQR